MPIRIGFRNIEMKVGMKATVNYGSDSHPAKVVSFRETPAYLFFDLQEFHYHMDPSTSEAETPGHQNWIIDWDKPYRDIVHAKVNKKNGKFCGRTRSFCVISLGHAHVFYDWSF